MVELVDILPDAFSLIKSRISSGQSVAIQVWSDSLGNGSSGPREWPYLLADWLVSKYPTHGVELIPWGGSSTYDAAVVLSTGSTSAKITIYNFAVSGANAHYGLGNFFLKAMRTNTVDLCIINHGKNMVTGQLDTMIRGMMLAAVQQYRQYQPNVPIAWIIQPPNTDNSNMIDAFNALKYIAGLINITLIDTYSPFIALDSSYLQVQSPEFPNGLYIDTVHPNQDGQNLMMVHIKTAWDKSIPFVTNYPPSLFSTKSYNNLLDNGNFSKWTTSPGAPDGWTLSGTGLTAEKELSIVPDSYSPWTVKLTGDGVTSGLASLNQSITGTLLTILRGKRLTVAARCRKLSADVANARVSLVISGGTNVTTPNISTQQDGWVWYGLSGVQVADAASAITVRLYQNTDLSNPAAGSVYWDQVCLLVGDLPGAAR